MIIKKKRIRTLSSLSFIGRNDAIRFGVSNIERFESKLSKAGFSDNLSFGETVLPAKIGPVTLRNSEGHFIKHKDKEMERVFRSMTVTLKQWAGRGETRHVTDFVSIPYKRYPRTFVPPQSIELSIADSSAGKLIVTPEINFSEGNKDRIVHLVNIILEIFGECEVFNSNLTTIKKQQIISLNWEILPKGDLPFEHVEERIESFVTKARKSNQPVIEARLKKLYGYSPDFEARGLSGFSGYMVLGYEKLNLYILESIYPDNATYVFDKDWMELSKFTKAEILNNKFQKARLIHTDSWNKSVEGLLA